MKLLTILFLGLFAMTASANEWVPPENPDVRAIRKEAEEDERAGRYELALAKRVWFHEHVNNYEPSMSAVRLSFALSEWLDLATVYPPALEKMREVRDETKSRILTNDSKYVLFDDLSSFTAINKKLGEEAVTVTLFKLVEKQNPTIAKKFYIVADDALIQAKEFELCNKYLEPDKKVNLAIEAYSRESKTEIDPKYAKYAQLRKDSQDNRFIKDAATLVALLVINDRKDEAEKAVTKFKTVEADADFHEKLAGALDKALAAKLPERR